jgi:hypothetical protein
MAADYEIRGFAASDAAAGSAPARMDAAGETRE